MSAQKNEVTFQPGDRLFSEGDLLTSAYVIKSGKIELSKRVGEDEQVVVCVVTKGGIVGEMALVDNKPAEVTARVTEAVSLLIVDQLTFDHALNKASPMVRHLLMALTQRLRERTSDISFNTKIVR